MSIYLGTTKISGAYTIAKNIGEVFYSQSSSAADNPGGLPLFTGEMISNANQLYPQFYNWVLSHPELCTTNSAYETSITNWGKCDYYVIDDTNKTIKLPKIARENAYIIYNRNTGYEWCRVYSDGFCEQGAFIDSTTDGEITIQFFKEFDTSHPTVLISRFNNVDTDPGTGGVDRRYTTAVNVSSTGFSTWGQWSTNYKPMWSAFGYVDVQDYKKNPLYPWVFAYNSAISASVAQAAQFQSALSSKVDTDLNNIDPSFATNLISTAITGMMPDYAAGESKTWNTEYVADKNGWVAIYSFCSDDTNNPAILLVNNVDVLHFAGYYDAHLRMRMIAPVAVGDTYKAYGGDGEQSIQFFPCKAESQVSE